MVTFGFDLVHFIIILSISTATTGGGVLFSSWCQWSRKVGLFWPIWAILLRIYALFLVYSYSAKLCSGVAKLTNIRYALSIVFIFLKVFSLLSKPWSVCFRSENWFALQVESALAKVWNGFHRWYIRFVAILTILSMTLFYFNSNKGNSTICKKWAVFNFKRQEVCRHLLSLHKYSRLVFMYTFLPKSC